MKFPIRAAILAVIAICLFGFVSAVRGAGQYVKVDYPASTDTNELQVGVTYTLWIPDGVSRLRGIIVHQHGAGTTASKEGSTAAYDLHWQALAAKWDCALLGPSYHVLNEKTERNVFGDFQGAFDLVHGIDTARAVGGGNVDGRRSGTSPFVIRVQRRVYGIQRNAGGFEPVGNFANVLFAVGIVEVLPSGENLDRLGSCLDKFIEQARMKPFLHVDVCRYRPQHQ